MFNSCRFSQHGMLPRLPTLFESRLKLALSCRNHLAKTNKAREKYLESAFYIKSTRERTG